MKRFKLLSFLMFNAALSLEGRALAADTSIDPPTNQSQQSEGQLLSCALLIKSKDMPKAFRV
ncbi:MAG: hypothetical protein NTV34_20675, partial [Proteobacteria bacterium]|nr:hypothetical protein [Pseudomonadota bacterium]